MAKIELLSNGMIIFDNGDEIIQTFPTSVKFIRISRAKPDPKAPASKNEPPGWLVEVGGDMWIEFHVKSRDEGNEIRETINEILDTFTANGANGMHYG